MRAKVVPPGDGPAADLKGLFKLHDRKHGGHSVGREPGSNAHLTGGCLLLPVPRYSGYEAEEGQSPHGVLAEPDQLRSIGLTGQPNSIARVP